MFMSPSRLILSLAFFLAGCGHLWAKDFHHAVQYDYQINADLTYQQTTTQDVQILSERSVGEYSQISITYSPQSESLDILEAWVFQPDGTQQDVEPANIFTRPSAASHDAPGFVDTQTRTVVFPQVKVGSRVHLKAQQKAIVPPLLGFNSVLTGPAGGSLSLTATITAPTSVPLEWRQRGGFTVTDSSTDGTRRLAVALSQDNPTPPPEPHMVSLLDVQPVFVATTLSGYEQIAALYYRQNVGKADVTPAIQQLAERIADGRTGLDAARLIYNWVAGNIRYLAVWLDPNAGFVSHSAEEVIRNGYGDCKDHVVLTQALLAALGIRAQPALVNWDSRMQPLPLASSIAFNHVMVYLPDFDAYANPTNPFARFEALDVGLSNKLVAIATEQGEVRRTPQTSPADNQYRMSASVSVAPDGTITGSGAIAMSARIDSVVRHAVANETSPLDLASRLAAQTPEGGFGHMRTSNPRNLAVPFEVRTEWTSPHGVVMKGNPVPFVIPTGVDFIPYPTFRQYLSANGTRRYPLIIGAEQSTWTYEARLPEGFAAASMPPVANLSNEAGSYTASYEPVPGGLRVTRKLTIAKDVYGPQEYPALQSLLYGLIDDARSSVLLTQP